MRIYFHSLDQLPPDLRERIRKLYARDPITYAYLYYDLITPEESANTSLILDNSMVVLWRGLMRNDVLLYGNEVELIPDLDIHNIQTYNLEETEYLSRRFPKLRAIRYLDMICEPIGPSETATKLQVEDLDQLAEIRELSTGRISRERARRLLEKTFGVKEGGKLVSIGSSLVTLPEVWITGGMFTLPEYRGRGYAGEVVKAMAWEARRKGAIPLLHVREDNLPAIRAYSRVGCRELRRRWWFI
ncbi:GNAT family N-acetyltransferase [Metallosphaera javensis (ex Sakai et al. 2022)]|uniref:GNAT family N-acetyltransferase n=1 Tax=Metallosphaera javensis (ex Sakai et al. 2022) TaxID=2775498 RepID=UPI00258DC947|nr:MAG: acetyltransferase [Metallosphaera javensis (ex Sakai et al. 2022)]